MITTQDIVSVTENVFTTMLGAHVQLASEDTNLAENEPITGAIQISGEWTGAVLVQTTGALARNVASIMLAIDDESIQLIDLQDTMAEIANMVGGNIKSLVPGPSVLSLPTVTSGKEFDIRIFGTDIENSIPMECSGHPLRVVVCKAQGA